jgi:hypothetical protein
MLPHPHGNKAMSPLLILMQPLKHNLEPSTPPGIDKSRKYSVLDNFQRTKAQEKNSYDE